MRGESQKANSGKLKRKWKGDLCAGALPVTYFGGKRRVAGLVWPRFGDVVNYVEPFFGSGAMLLNRPMPFSGPETVNDADGFISNFWRAVVADPEGVAHAADWPVNECLDWVCDEAEKRAKKPKAKKEKS